MEHLFISFRGNPEPSPGAIPAAVATLRARRDGGEVGFVDAPADRTQVGRIREAAGRLRDGSDTVRVLGDRRVLAGAAALVAALADHPPVRFAATVKDVVPTDSFVFVSRYGEDLTAWHRIRKVLADMARGDWRERVAVVTDPARGGLREEAARTGVASFPFPKAVGDLVSALTPVGLLPAACAGADVVALLDGARDNRDLVDRAPFATNPAQRLAAVLGPDATVQRPPAGRLTGTAEWMTRLLFESDMTPGGGVQIRLETKDSGENGVAVRVPGLSEKHVGALVQTIATACALAEERS